MSTRVRLAALFTTFLVATGLVLSGYVNVDKAEAAAAMAVFPAVNPDDGGMTHCVLEFEPESDLAHYAKWTLDQVGVAADDQGGRYPDGWEMTELDMIWLFLTPGECADALALTGTGPLMNVEATSVVSLPTPVAGGSGPLAPPGQQGFQRVPNAVRRAGVPVDEWTSAPSSGGVRVAVIDTGIDATHDDLEGQVDTGFNCSQDERGPNGWGIDLHGHGTWVAGAIAAKHNDAYITSAFPGGTLLDEITFGSEGSASGAMVLCAVNKSLEHGADIISASLGGGHIATRCGGASVYTNGWCKAANRAVVVVAAGNDAVDAILKGPANVPGVVTVGAIVDFDGLPGGLGVGQGCGLMHADDALAIFSNWGSTVDVVANGGCELGLAPWQSWGISSGTSMSTPEVTAVMANSAARFPDCRGHALIAMVLNYAQDWAKDHPEDGYSGWPGADPPPMIRYVDEEPLRIQDPESPRPCAFQSSVVTS